jgi:hypothetical protein
MAMQPIATDVWGTGALAGLIAAAQILFAVVQPLDAKFKMSSSSLTSVV